MKRRRCQQAIDHGQRISPRLGGGRKQAPPVSNFCVARQDSPRKPGAQFYFEPCFALRAPPARRQCCKTLPNFADVYYTQMAAAFVGRFEPRHHPGFWVGPNRLRNAVCVEQESVHRSISRATSLSRSNYMSRPTKGDSRKNCARLLG